ncbi:MAG TPA: VCBS repeat domain-containing M23 family metallopeptidase [Nocardioidaceae bacterium]|nr:VCBS repeat domain-containing M23 family metallopeptidase [Actinomycetota bacterium]HEV8056579.1 VCBS repeat domain-containing M23 family metallopeptidase [Nocardioidaceae bacterium]
MRGALRSTLVAVGVAPLALGPVAHAVLPEDYQVPFPCGQTWDGETRSGHNPYWAIDFNRDAYDLGALTVASAPGVVTTVANLGDSSYGRYVVVDHAGAHSTLIAHLSQVYVSVGQRVDIGAPLGAVGSTGGSSGPHLHYEQRVDRADQPAVFDGTRFRYGSAIRSRNCKDVPITGDWDGNRRFDVGVFRPRPATGSFRMRLPSGETRRVLFGAPGRVAVTGDWNGDGRTDVGVYNQQNRTFTRRFPDGRVDTIRAGRTADVPVTGDWDGNGRTDVGVWRPAEAKFVLRGADGRRTTRLLGTVSNTPVTGDWDGDGRTDVGVVNRTTMRFTLRHGDGTLKRVRFGQSGDLPVTGDWDGNARTDVGVWRPSTGQFLTRLSAKRFEQIRYGRIR